MEKESKLINRIENISENVFNNRLFKLIVLAGILISGAVYCYGLVSAILPCGEECGNIYYPFLADKFNIQSRWWGSFNSIINNVVYKLYGLNYESMNVINTIRFLVVLCPTCIVALCFNKRDEIGFYGFPILVLLLVEQKLIKTTSDYGYSAPGEDIIAGYPFVYHTPSLMFAATCLIFLGIIISLKNKKEKTIIACTMLCFICMIHSQCDLIFYATLVTPLIIVGMFYLLHNDKYRKYLIGFVIVVLMLCISTKILRGEMHDLLWSSAYTDQYSGLYGSASWTLLRDLPQNFNNLIVLICDFFNIEKQHETVVSLWTIVIFVRIFLIIISVNIVFDIVKSIIQNTSKENGYDIIDEVCAVGIIIQVFVKLFTTYNYIRFRNYYFYAILLYASILIVRNIRGYLKRVLKFDCLLRPIQRLAFCTIMVCIVVLAVENVWNNEIINSDGKDIDACIEYVVNNGEGYAIVPYHLYGRFGVQAGDDVRFFLSEEQHDSYCENEQPRYFINNFDLNDNMAYRNDDNYTYENMCEDYEQPVKEIRFGRIHLYQLW